MLQVYDFECSVKVRTALAEKNVAWSRQRVDLLAFESKTSGYLQLNPNGVVPTIQTERGEILIETDIIDQYIDEAYEGPALSPPDAFARARMRNQLKIIEDAHLSYGLVLYDQVMLPFWRDLPEQEFEALTARFASREAATRMSYLVKNGVKRKRVTAELGRLKRLFTWAELQLETNPWIGGTDFSLADISLLPYVDTRMRIVSELWRANGTNLARWLDAMHSRPSYALAVKAFPPTPRAEAYFVRASQAPIAQ